MPMKVGVNMTLPNEIDKNVGRNAAAALLARRATG